MNFNGWSNFEDFARACGYTASNNTNSSQDGSKNMGCNDIPNGFQSLDPQLFVIIGTILGQVLAGNIPFNVQNALGNWFELLGQVLLTYNAQQQYFQSGPGSYFNPNTYNKSNDFCNTSENTTSDKTSTENANNDQMDKINELEARINALVAEIELLKKQ